ncbi:MAG: glycogen debranching protein GlgX [Betaproteobacteria bacterium]
MRVVGPGHHEPLGLTLVPGGANVAVLSAHAQAIVLCLFDTAGDIEVDRIVLPARTGDVFHGFVGGIAAGARYGLRAHGPYEPHHGHRFNAAKLLVDPYARTIDRAFALHPAQFGATDDGARDDTDSAPFVPKAIAVAATVAAPDTRPRVPWADTIVYELHVRGFTKAHPDVPEALRGTCAGLAHPAAIAHLVRLGITTVELMPIAAAIDERHLAPLGLTNYWGYNPVAWLTPDPRLAPSGIGELRDCVAALHAAGIEVLLDIVLNHTGEGDERGPTLSLRGLDNATFYRTLPFDAARYVDDTGCGNTVALDRPPAVRLALDTLRHYALAANVDGFRFDLATTLGRRTDGFDPAAPLLAAIAQDPVLRDLKLVAEPWDVGPGGYRAGDFPPSWGEWNDRYRDTVRRFWRGDAGLAGDLATRIAGSADVFAARSRSPSRAVNFVAAHDGFTLADLVAHAHKHNEANGEGNRDGSDANHSWNHGVEGPTADCRIVAARRRDVKALLATLLLSRGTPMLAMGDESGRTQHGNNNAYAQDNALAWLDWAGADRALAGFVTALIAARRRHPALRGDRWLTGEPVDASGIPDVEWRHPDGRAMTAGDWSSANTRALVAVLYVPGTATHAADRVLLAINGGDNSAILARPDPRNDYAWQTQVDTFVDTLAADAPTRVVDAPSVLAPRSVVLLAEIPDATPRAHRTGIEPAVLDRLVAAAGIAPEWWSVSGEHHAVVVDTKRALLAAMLLTVDSTGDARARLVELALRRERRPLPVAVVAVAGGAPTVALALADSRGGRRELRLSREDGTDIVLPVDLDALPTDSVTAADGRSVSRRIVTLPSLPVGVHTLTLDDDPASLCRVVVAPLRCHLPPELAAAGRRFGLAAHLYALRRRGDQGIGDFTTLAEAGVATARAGGAIVGINPLHALVAEDRSRASPYHPSDRRFLDPIYLDVTRVPDLAASADARALLDAHAGTIAALSAAPIVDYAGVWAVKRAVLAACHAAFLRRPRGDPLVADFEAFGAAGGAPLAAFARFHAIADAHPDRRWPDWPAGLRHPDAADVAAFAARHGRAVGFACYLQWLADRALGEAASRASTAGLALGLYRDLAVGAAPDGAEAWANPDALARGASIGAPPDPFSGAGQVWCLPPPIPDAMATGGYAGFRALVAANMRHAGALRIDHAMGLARLFWVPDGATAADGAYVRYPLHDLLGALALESVRARCLVVGEDLGTVPEGFREQLAAADVLSYRVLWFERDGAAFRPPSAYPAKAAACITTHDLPTIAGWWSGADIDENAALGRATDDDDARERDARRVDRSALSAALVAAGVADSAAVDPDRAHDAGVTAAIHRYAGATPAALVLVQADDLAGETTALNLPDTDRERANWRRKVGVDADALWTTPAGVEASADLSATRGVRRAIAPATHERNR